MIDVLYRQPHGGCSQTCIGSRFVRILFHPSFPVPAPCAKLSFAFTVVTQPCWVFADLHESPFPSVVEHSSRGPRDSGSKMARIAYSLLGLVFAATAGLVAGESFRGSYPLAIS